MRRPAVALALLGTLVGAAAGWGWWRTREPARATAAEEAGEATDSSRAPVGVRVRVEVLNASGVRGLARRATMHLRDLGYDVVSSGNAGESRDSSLVLLRRGDRDWAERLGRAMGGARVESRPDSSRYVDLTVLVGGEWRPPPGPLRP